MAYGSTTLVKEMCGNVGVADIPSATLTQAVAVGDSLVNTWTGKSDWDSDDVEYELVQAISEKFAASYCLKRFNDQEKKSRELHEEALKDCDILRQSSATLAIVTQSSRQSWPMNNDSNPYRSNSEQDEQ